VAPPRDLSIRPLGLGEIIDRSIALTRRHFRPLFAAMLAIEAPALALGRLQQARAVEALALLADPARAVTEAASFGWLSLGFLLALLVLQLAATAAAAAIVAPSLDPSAQAGPSGARRVVAVVTAGIVQLVVLLLAPLLGLLPGLVLAVRAQATATRWVGVAAAAAGGLVVLTVAVLRLVLVPAVAAVEGRGGIGAALRSSRLMAPIRGGRVRDRPGLRASLVLLATFLLVLAASGLAGLPRAIAARATGTVGPLGLLGAALPLPLEVAVSIFEAAATAAIQPFSLVAVAVLYFDRRARTEALDVEIWAARLEAER
jgi:hypothetical protein